MTAGLAERWEQIRDWPDYEVSTLGRVRRLTKARNAPVGAVLSARGLRNGYPSVDLCRDGVKRSFHVHRLVADAFLGSCPIGREVNHMDGDKTNPQLGNLEYVTRAQNQAHAYRTGLQTAAGSRNGQAKLTEAGARQILRLGSGPGRLPYGEIGKRFGVSSTTVRDIVRHRAWRHVH